MKRTFTKLTTCCLAVAATLATGCLGDEMTNSGGGTVAEPTDPVVPDNSVIDARVFAALDLDREGLSAVKSYYEAGQYYPAAQALLEYYRSRTEVVNGNVNLISPTISAEEQARADWALPPANGSTEGYRLYVEGYDEGDRPCSYLVANRLDWRAHADDAEQHYRLHRLQWLVPQGKAYRTSLDEKYAEAWMELYADWLANYPRPTGEGIDYEGDPAAQPVAAEQVEMLYAWRPVDVAWRLEDQCDLMYYFMQSSSLTPQLFASFLANLAEQAEHLRACWSDDRELRAREAHAVFRAGTIFPEMKQAREWVESGEEFMNEGIDTSVFGVLDLEYGGLTKVKRAYEANDCYAALAELLNYYRSRTHGRNPNVDLANAAPTESERRWADYALRENGYRFYVKNFFDAAAGDEVPYSYRKGEGIDWTYWPTRDQEQRYQLHRLQWMLPQAKTYYATRDERYARNWMEVYGDWIRRNPRADRDLDYGIYPEKQPEEYRNAAWSWRPLDVAARMLDQCAVLEYYQDSESVTAEWLAEVYYRLDEQIEHIVRNYSTTSNHLITQAQAVTFAGVLFPELKHSGAWVGSGAEVLNREVTAQYFPDGWLMDGDLHYHISSIEDFRSTMLLARINGMEERFPAGYVEAMRKMTDVVMNMIYPDYTVPNMTDTRRSTWSRNVLLRNLSNYSALFPDNDGLRWMATAGAGGTMPGTRVKCFPDGGYYVLRSGWTMDDMMMVLQNTPDDPSEKWHRQYDNNTFELWVRGRNFFPDSGCFTYGGNTASNAMRRKFAASTAHNTLTLDGRNVHGDGRMLRQESKSTASFSYEVLVLENPSYDDLTHRRVVFFVDNRFYVVLDEARGTAEGTLNLNFNITEGSKSQVVLDPEEGGFHTAFADGNNLLVRTVVSKKGVSFRAMEGFVSYKTDTQSERQAYQLNVEKRADEPVVRYTTLLLPTADAAAGEWSVSTEPGSDKGTTVRVTVGDRTYKLSYSL